MLIQSYHRLLTTERITPSRPSQRATKTKFTSIAHGPDQHPIICNDSGAWRTYCDGRPYQGGGHVKKTYPESLASLLAYLAAHPERIPETLCLNCFLFHPGHPCASPTHHWSSHIDPLIHSTCSHCATQHHIGEPCPNPPTPALPL